MEERQIRIHNAVRQCVRECHASLTPFLAIGKYCERLRTDRGWGPTDVEQVESLAWRELQTLRGEFGHDR
jgi:hypothetical protein